MEAVIQVFTQLGVDKTVFYQFIIFCGFYAIVGPFFFKKLQEVIEDRENKTIKLKTQADHLIHKSEKIDEQFKSEMTHVRNEVQAEVRAKKQKIDEEEKKKIKAADAEIESGYEESRLVFERQIGVQKEELMKKADGLSEELIQRLS